MLIRSACWGMISKQRICYNVYIGSSWAGNVFAYVPLDSIYLQKIFHNGHIQMAFLPYGISYAPEGAKDVKRLSHRHHICDLSYVLEHALPTRAYWRKLSHKRGNDEHFQNQGHGEFVYVEKDSMKLHTVYHIQSKCILLFALLI